MLLLPDYINREAWEGWLEMRRKIKKPATERAQRMALRILESYHEQGYDVTAVLDASTFHCWQGLYCNGVPRIAPKAGPGSTSPERAQEILEMIERQRAAARLH